MGAPPSWFWLGLIAVVGYYFWQSSQLEKPPQSMTNPEAPGIGTRPAEDWTVGQKARLAGF